MANLKKNNQQFKSLLLATFSLLNHFANGGFLFYNNQRDSVNSFKRDTLPVQ